MIRDKHDDINIFLFLRISGIFFTRFYAIMYESLLSFLRVVKMFDLYLNGFDVSLLCELL